MKVEALHIYPVKGLRGVDLRESPMEWRGLAHDRRWMLVDAHGMFISQREEPRLARLRPELCAGGLQVGDGASTICIPTPEADAERLPVTLWGEALEGYRATSEADEWFSRFLGKRCRLVYQGDLPRPVPRKYAPEDRHVSFVDALPVLITTMESLGDLNRRMEKPLPMNRFRPSLVVSGAEAWSEDSWKMLCIGKLLLSIAKPCLRCAVTTTDQQTGVRDGREPLATLGKFRRVDQASGSGVAFGQYAVPLAEGAVAVGEEVAVVEAQAPLC
ncbi:MAG: MOSC domain-containing protein [Terriglobales bacterium]